MNTINTFTSTKGFKKGASNAENVIKSKVNKFEKHQHRLKKFYGVHDEVKRSMFQIKMFCLGKSIDLNRLKQIFKKKKILKNKDFIGVAIRSMKIITADTDDEEGMDYEKLNQVFNVKNYSTIQRHKSRDFKYIFIFQRGGIVFWNFTKIEEDFMLSIISKYTEDLLENPLSDFFHYVEKADSDNFHDYVQKNYIDNDILFLESGKFDEKVAISAACSHNITLDFQEDDLREFIIKKVKIKRANLVRKNKKKNIIQKSYKDIMEIYVKRIDALNDIDLPNGCEYIYENDTFYLYYKMTSNYFDIRNRIKGQNEKSQRLTDSFVDRVGELNQINDTYLYHWFFFWIGMQILVNVVKVILDCLGIRGMRANSEYQVEEGLSYGPVLSLLRLFFGVN